MDNETQNASIMRYTIVMFSKSLRKKFLLLGCMLCCGVFGYAPNVFAQAYVPVRDIQLNQAFSNYVTSLFQHWDNTFGAGAPTGTSDNLRDLIAGRNPTIPGGDTCQGGDNLPAFISAANPNPAFAYGQTSNNPNDWGPWMFAVASSSGAIPNAVPAGANANSGPYVQVNYSHSLRCLLEEVVENQKLQSSVQIHQMLLQYISNAQTAQLTKQLKNKIIAANFNFSKGGNVVNNNGVISNSPTFITNYNQTVYNANGRQLETIIDQAATDPNVNDPEGSLGLCQPWRLETAVMLAENNRTSVEDPKNFTQSKTECTLTSGTNPTFANQSDYENFSLNFDDPSSLEGGYFTFLRITSNPADNPLNSSAITDMVARERIENQEKKTDADTSKSGNLALTDCPQNDPSNPHSIDTECENITTQHLNGETTANLVQDLNAVESDSIDSQSATSSQRAGTDLITNTGQAGANTLPLETAGTAINSLIREFYDSIDIGYFGIQQNTTEWAQATMLSIYDEMKFSQNLSSQGATVVTNGQASQPTDY